MKKLLEVFYNNGEKVRDYASDYNDSAFDKIVHTAKDLNEICWIFGEDYTTIANRVYEGNYIPNSYMYGFDSEGNIISYTKEEYNAMANEFIEELVRVIEDYGDSEDVLEEMGAECL